MHEVLIENHNRVVRPTDKVYFIGDVVIKKPYLPLLNKFNGKKRLVLGNHDVFTNYTPYFQKICGVRIFAINGLKAILSHIPIHPSSIVEGHVNIHGHLHKNQHSDPRYINVCVEQNNFTPINIDELITITKNRGINT
jgi:calcineurin-like phosphoesterase family protein